MANLDDIERLDREIRAAERNAMSNLAAHLREAVRDLPSQSRLALYFVQHAKTFDVLATGTDPIHCSMNLRLLERDVDELLGDEGDEEGDE